MAYFKPAIIICSRTDSERLPNKAFRKVNDTPVLAHLLTRLLSINIPIVLAVPNAQRDIYDQLLMQYPHLDSVLLHSNNFDEDPLARMADVLKFHEFTHVVRITHDKIFVDTENLELALKVIEGTKIEYAYSSQLLPGTGFEILSAECVFKATAKFKNVEHISYAARLVSENTKNLYLDNRINLPHNLLIDLPEDLQLMEVIHSQLGDNCSFDRLTEYLKSRIELAAVNMVPLVSVYICAYNADKFLKKAMASVEKQRSFFDYGELILIDDGSTDQTCQQIAEFAAGKKNVFWFRHPKNKGLATASNLGLKKSRGKYIIRLDADDYFTSDNAVLELLSHIQETKSEIVYPDNYFGSFDKIQKGKEQHHVGGAIFDRRALNFIKFTDGLRNYEGFDLYTRAQDTLKISYYDKPVFFYTQREGSLSKTNLAERKRTFEAISKQNRGAMHESKI
jgi:spore coat polysaccharide biosynthesis protein SpsF (cytidylyltransferase family)